MSSEAVLSEAEEGSDEDLDFASRCARIEILRFAQNDNPKKSRIH
jgi:hypothetical protein